MTRAFSLGALVTAAFFRPLLSSQAKNSVSPGTRFSTDSAQQHSTGYELVCSPTLCCRCRDSE